MSNRIRWQYFYLPEGYDPATRPQPRSQWWKSKEAVIIPRDCWENIIGYIMTRDLALGKSLDVCSSVHAYPNQLVELSELRIDAEFLLRMETFQYQLMAIVGPQPEEFEFKLPEEFQAYRCPDHLTPTDFAEMLEWVRWVLSESLRLGVPLRVEIE